MTTATVLYVLNNTDDSQRIVIQPRIFDGAGGVQRNTDLTLYGNGAPRWGERFNENFVRLMENFAVAESGGSDGVPVALQLPAPKGEIELAKGTGYGINNPVEGQTWFNKSRGTLFVYTRIQSDGAGGFGIGTAQWKPVTQVLQVENDGDRDAAIPNARPGEIVFRNDSKTMEVYDGATWNPAGGSGSEFVLRAGDTMTGALRLHAGHTVPANANEAASKFYVDQQRDTRLALTGGSLTGTLFMGNQQIRNMLGPSVASDAATKGYVDAAIGSVGGGVTDHGALTGLADNDHPQYLLRSGAAAMTGQLTLLAADPVNGNHATRKSYVDGLFASISSNPDILLGFGEGVGYSSAAPTLSVPFPPEYNETNSFLVISLRGFNYFSRDGTRFRCWVEGVVPSGWIVYATACQPNCSETRGGGIFNYWIFKNGDPIPELVHPPYVPPGGGGGGGGGDPINPLPPLDPL